VIIVAKTQVACWKMNHGDSLDTDELEALMNSNFLSDDMFGTIKEEESIFDDTALERMIGMKFKREEMDSLLGTSSESPPRYPLESDLDFLQGALCTKNSYMEVVAHPPLEVRTRTKNENRTFTCSVAVFAHAVTASVELCYATEVATVVDTLGGTLTKPVVNGKVSFDDLAVSVASPKHAEKEFVLRIRLNSLPDHCVYSTPFYAYSHKSVLLRRREVCLRASSNSTISCLGEQNVHVVGTPFVRSDRLQCVIRVKTDQLRQASPDLYVDHDDWLSLRADNVEHFSESVLFFDTPSVFRNCVSNIQAFLQVTNDGRNFSNPIPIEFTADINQPSPKRICAPSSLRSRM